jgi:mannose-6-phosphate isomerase-like protein (cupin superfamily)
MERNRVPKMHAYHDHVFVILHGDGAWTRQSGRPPRRCPAGDPRGA